LGKLASTGKLLTCYGEVANLLWTSYRETGVMDFDLNAAKSF